MELEFLNFVKFKKHELVKMTSSLLTLFFVDQFILRISFFKYF